MGNQWCGSRGSSVVPDVFYINLARDTKRNDYMASHLAARGLTKVARWEAVDARAGLALDATGYRAGGGSRWNLTASEIACFESHRRLWQEIVERDLRSAIIFEDDVLLSEGVSDIAARLSAADDAFDVVKLDKSPQILRFGPEKLLNGVAVREMKQTAASAAAYMVSREGCAKLLEWSRVYCDHLDDFLYFRRRDWRMMQLFPAVAIQHMWTDAGGAIGLDETILRSERTRDKSTNAGKARGPLGFRLKKELVRGGTKFVRAMGADLLTRKVGGYVGEVELLKP